jgi:hypothetical protein
MHFVLVVTSILYTALGKSEYSVNVESNCVVKSTCGIDGEAVDGHRPSVEVDSVERDDPGTGTAILSTFFNTHKDTVTMSMSLVFLAYLVGSALFTSKEGTDRDGLGGAVQQKKRQEAEREVDFGRHEHQ